jgi:transposase InsO family protein
MSASLTYREAFESIRRGKELAFDYIEVFYNRQRRHSSIGYRTPAESCTDLESRRPRRLRVLPSGSSSTAPCA